MMYHPRVYEITLDRYLGVNEQEVIFHQYDTESATLSFMFLENGVPFDIPYTRLVLVIRKPDQKEVYQNIETFSGNTAEIILHNQALTVAGTLKCQIKMYQESKLESTWTFEVKVKPSIGNEDAIESTDEYQVLQQLFLDVDSKKGEMEQAITENINQNNNATQQSIDEMKSATDEAIRSIDESAVGILNQQVLVSNYQTFTAIGSMSRVGENKVATPSHLMETLELGDDDYDQRELLETPATLEEPMEEEIENHPMTLEEPMIVDNDVVPTESGFAKSAILKGVTGYKDVDTGEILETFEEGRNLELVSVKMPVLTTVGKNLLPCKTIYNNISLMGLTINTENDRVRVSGIATDEYNIEFFNTNVTSNDEYIKVKPNTKYILSATLHSGSISDKLNLACKSIADDGTIRWLGSTFTTNSNESKVNRIRIVVPLGFAFNDAVISLQLEESTVATTYEPYKSNTLSTPSDLVLRGIGDVKDTLDVNTGEVVQRIGEVIFDGSEAWTIGKTSVNTVCFQVGLSSLNINVLKNNFITNYLIKNVGLWGSDVECATINGSFTHFQIRLNKTKASTVDEVKQYLNQNPLTVHLELASPIIKTVDLNNKPFFFKEGHILLSSEEGTLLPTLEYTVPTNLKGQADNSAESILSLEREKLDIKLVDMKATPNSVVKRDQDGNVRTANKLQMKQADQEIPIELIANSHLKVGNRNVWDDGNLMIERGTFTPSLGCTQGTFPTMNAQSTGSYYRIGEMVYVSGRVLANKANVGQSSESKGELYLRGLPFQVYNASGHFHQFLHIANVQMINFGSHQQLTLHLTNGDATAKLRWIDNQTTGWPVVQMSDFGTNNFGFAFSGFYRIR